jgi:phosphoglycolate phosphatase
MRFKAVIFDLDGTLLDTIDDLTDAMNAALAAMGFPRRTIAECKKLVGDGLETYVRRALPPGAADDPRVAVRLKEHMRAEYKVRQDNKTKPFEGIDEMLDSLDGLGIPLAVLSNKPHDSTLAVMKRYFPGRDFRVIFGARDGIPVKPDPSAALEIARLLNVPPKEIAYVGDTNTDMQTANAAGMFAVGALWGFRTAEELLTNGARALIEKPEDLLGVLSEKS